MVDGPKASGALAKMFRDGAAGIATHKSSNLFKQLDSRNLTLEEQAVIDQRVALQRRMFQVFEKQESARKVEHVQEVHADVSEEAARQALQWCGGSEEQTIAALADADFKGRVQAMVRDIESPPVDAAPPGVHHQPRQRTSAPSHWGGRPSSRRPTVVDPASLGTSVFLGKFRGRGPTVSAQPPRPALTARQRAVASQQRGAGSSTDSAEAYPTEGGNGLCSASDGDADVCSAPAQSPAVMPRLTRAAAAAAAVAAAQAEVQSAAEADTAAADLSPTVPLGTSAVAPETVAPAAAASISEGAPAADPLASTEPTESEKLISTGIVADSCRAEGPLFAVPSPADMETKPSDCESHGAAQTQQLQGDVSHPVSAPAELPHTADREPAGTCPGVTDSASALTPVIDLVPQAINASCCAAAETSTRPCPHPQQSQSGSSQHTPFNAGAAATAQSDDELEVVSPPPGGWTARPVVPEAPTAAAGALVGGGAADGKVMSASDSAAETAGCLLTGAPQPKESAARQPVDDEETISVDVGSCMEAGPSATSQLKGRDGSPLRRLRHLPVVETADEDTASDSQPSRKPAPRSTRRASIGRSKKGGKGTGRSGAISRNGGTVRGRVRQKSHKQASLLALGNLRPDAGWFNAGYIFPDGFQSRVNFRSSVQLDQLVAHECAIIGEGGVYWPGPTFRVVAQDRPLEPLLAKSCTGCWTQVLKRINSEIEGRRRNGEDLPPPPKTAIAGPEYFGLNQPEIEGAIEGLDPMGLCAVYWAGKGDRAAVAAGLPLEGSGSGGARPVSKPSRGGTSRKGKRRRDDSSSEEDPGGNDGCEDDDSGTNFASRWSAVGRAQRYRSRCAADGEVVAEEADDSNPLPGRLDPVTLEPVVCPAISPHGHVMGAATWKAVLAEQGKCPFTGRPLSWAHFTILTHSNIARFRDRIID